MIFNSLGSNYDFSFILQSLFASGGLNDQKKLKNFIQKRYQGEVALLYKGREAIKLALEILDLPKNSKVGITGFTCFAVYQAVSEAGLSPELIDIEDTSLNFSISGIKKHPGIKVLIVQNTLGVPCNIQEIAKYCKENNIFIIEDLAHCVGTTYTNGKEVGTVGDFTALSFSQDKMVDAISGGALVIRNENFKDKLTEKNFTPVNFSTQLIDRFYPLFTFLIRKTYPLGLGKVIHVLLKRFGLLSKPMPNGGIIYHNLPGWYCHLIKSQFEKLHEAISHRNKMIAFYSNEFPNSPPGVLRFPIYVNMRKKLISFLKSHGIFLGDIWYDAPVAPGRYMEKTNYKGDCPISEKVCDQILNLPTHINVGHNDALRVASQVKIWQSIH